LPLMTFTCRTGFTERPMKKCLFMTLEAQPSRYAIAAPSSFELGKSTFRWKRGGEFGTVGAVASAFMFGFLPQLAVIIRKSKHNSGRKSKIPAAAPITKQCHHQTVPSPKHLPQKSFPV
jgi:hypothetical protein